MMTAVKYILCRIIEYVLYIILLIPFRKKKGYSKKSPADALRVLIIEPYKLGDMISVLAMAQALREACPEVFLIVVTTPQNREIINADAKINSVWTAPFPWANDYGKKWGRPADWIAVIKLFRQIREEKIDVGFDARGDLRSQIFLRLCHCEKIVGHTQYVGADIKTHGLLLTHSLGHPQNKHRWLRNRELVFRGMDLPVTPLRFPVFTSRKNLAKKNHESYIVIHPGASWHYKRWNAESWKKVTEDILNQTSFKVKAVAGPGEKRLLKEIQTESDRCIYCQTGTISEFIDLVSFATVFIGCDSGPMNVAASLGVPVLALFGPGDPEQWKPLSRGSRYIHHVYPCNPCDQKTCIYPHNSCMSQIRHEEVMKKLMEILNDINSE